MTENAGYLVALAGPRGAHVICPGCDTEQHFPIGQVTCTCGHTFTIIPETYNH